MDEDTAAPRVAKLSAQIKQLRQRRDEITDDSETGASGDPAAPLRALTRDKPRFAQWVR